MKGLVSESDLRYKQENFHLKKYDLLFRITKKIMIHLQVSMNGF